jgi:hypothetical protein
VRKEFEKWAVLTYTNNRAVINDKKGADKGIDGTAYLLTGRDDDGNNVYSPIILSVKSGNVGAAFMRDLRGTIERENAAVGILITRNEPTRPMIEEAKAAGKFQTEFGVNVDRLQIVTVQKILDGEQMSLPLFSTAEVARRAQKSRVETNQSALQFD